MREADEHLHAQFKSVTALNGQKSDYVQCRHCNDEKAKNVSRMAKHLEKCTRYINSQAAKTSTKSSRQPFKQMTLTIKALTPDEKASFEKLAAYAVYCGARPFQMYQEPSMKQFIKHLNPAYDPPSAYLLANRLLDDCYEETFGQFVRVLKECKVLNVSVDESSTINRDRVINACILTEQGPFCLKYEKVSKGTSSAERQAEWLVKLLDDLEKKIQFDLPTINCVMTDTCSTMRKFWAILSKIPRFKYSFFVPCDSHGLQLLIKDIVTLNYFEPTIKKAQAVVSHFRSAHKQLALLRWHQTEIYGKEYALTLSCDTRWGTHYYELKALERSRHALIAFSKDKESECGDQAVLETVNDSEFWTAVVELIDILKPIHLHQKRSESSRSNVGEVRERWLAIRDHLRTFNRVSIDLLGVFDARFPIQTSDLHLTAHHLLPVNPQARYEGLEQPQIISFLKDHVPQVDRLTIQREYLHYKNRSDEFAHAELWEKELIELPRDFWELAEAYAPTLASVALRLLRTTSNSVPCERAFSTMKLNHTRDRNRLKATTVDRLCFIHINRRVLDREERKARIIHIADLKEAEEVELEDIMASLGDSRPQYTEMEGGEGRTTQESTLNSQNSSRKRPRGDDVDDEVSGGDGVDEPSRERANERLNECSNASKMRSDGYW